MLEQLCQRRGLRMEEICQVVEEQDWGGWEQHWTEREKYAPRRFVLWAQIEAGLPQEAEVAMTHPGALRTLVVKHNGRNKSLLRSKFVQASNGTV